MIDELIAESEQLLSEYRGIWEMIEDDLKRIPLAMQLHLELNLEYSSDEQKKVLRKYGKMKDGITRDFIVPGNMTLHGLHYAIMKAFGWQNSHLHCYVPYEDEYKQMTDGGLVKEWIRQVGMHFRFPSGNYEDLFWDDDYEEEINFKTWLKSKYCGPYQYEGVGEHYVPAQILAERFRKENPGLLKKTTDQSTWNLLMEGQCEEILERLMIFDILKTPDQQVDWDSWKKEKENSLKQVEKNRMDAMKKYNDLSEILAQTIEEAECEYVEGEDFNIEMISLFQEMENLNQELEDLCFDYNPEPIPAVSALCYRYDYGDGWEIKITCTNAWYDKSIYSKNEDGKLLYDKNGFISESPLFVDAFGQQVHGEYLDRLKTIGRKEKPVCIAWDGINLMDDVGGVGGFCDFLEMIHSSDQKEKKRYREWAKGQGWTGRMPKTENIL
ncbi:MAG: hypothetical protein Q4B85_12435 [Lachnospiraceae bacterium]|nr:hypothetical protein [Lachnospiraceae bacterium]